MKTKQNRSQKGAAASPSAEETLTLPVQLDVKQSQFLSGLAMTYGLPPLALAQLAVREWIEERQEKLPKLVMK